LLNVLMENPTFTGAMFFLYGALFGSLANVIIYRLPQGKSIVKPRSACPKCEKQIAWYDNIPIVSWIILRAKCRNCKAKIHWRYPLVEFITGLCFAGLYYQVGFSWLLLEYLIFVYFMIVASFIDFDHMILPDVFTLGGIVVGLIGAALNPERAFLPAFYGVLLGGGFLWAIAYAYFVFRKVEGMGGGDIKLLGWIGAMLGWQAIPFVVLSSSILGSVVGLIAAFRTKGGLNTAIPFGPYLALGALLYIFGGEGLAQWYWNLFVMPMQQ
jgi:leader peptidase (prepilin peptidase)/N-methyltransferase